MASWRNWFTQLAQTQCRKAMKVRILLGLPFIFILSCAPGAGVTETQFDGCESIDTTPDDNEEWAVFCYCQKTDEKFTQCIDDWNEWNKHQ